jgi:hypothetical protein
MSEQLENGATSETVAIVAPRKQLLTCNYQSLKHPVSSLYLNQRVITKSFTGKKALSIQTMFKGIFVIFT